MQRLPTGSNVMDNAQLIQLLQNKGSNTAPLEQSLEKELNAHPYFTAVRLLRLKALQESQSLSFDAELKRTAVHIHDRRQLFEWVSMPLAPSDRSFEEGELAPQTASTLQEEIQDSGNEEQESSESPLTAEPDEAEAVVEEAEKEFEEETAVGVEAALEEEAAAENDEKAPEAEEHSAEQEGHTPAEANGPAEESASAEDSPAEADEQVVADPADNTHLVEKNRARPELPEDIVDPAAAARKRVEDLLAAHKKRNEPKDEGPATESKTEEENTENAIPTQEEAQTDEQPVDATSEESTATEEQAIQPELEAPASEGSGSAVDEQQAEAGSGSFSDWLSSLPSEQERTARKKEQIELVDQFLKDPPRFQPKKEKTEKQRPNIASESVQDRSEFMTETLAKLYIEQGHLEKAIQAYDILRLRFPEKSSFFAGRIRALKQQLKKES